jgi:hypothetical protein
MSDADKKKKRKRAKKRERRRLEAAIEALGHHKREGSRLKNKR